jgi:hypothetical protein
MDLFVPSGFRLDLHALSPALPRSSALALWRCLRRRSPSAAKRPPSTTPHCRCHSPPQVGSSYVAAARCGRSSRGLVAAQEAHRVAPPGGHRHARSVSSGDGSDVLRPRSGGDGVCATAYWSFYTSSWKQQLRCYICVVDVLHCSARAIKS